MDGTKISGQNIPLAHLTPSWGKLSFPKFSRYLRQVYSSSGIVNNFNTEKTSKIATGDGCLLHLVCFDDVDCESYFRI